MDSDAANRKAIGGPPLRMITRVERRRTWSAEQKRTIVEESLLGGLPVCATARKHDVSPGLLFSWRRQLLAGMPGSPAPRSPAFARVAVVESLGRPEAGSAHAGSRATGADDASMAGVMEIVLAAATVRVDASVDGATLRRVLAALGHR